MAAARVHALRRDSSRSEARQRLADCIEALTAAKDRLKAIIDGDTTARENIHAAEAAFEAAEVAVEEARQGTTQHLVAKALGGSKKPAKSIREAKSELDGCREELDAAREARSLLQAQRPAAQNDIEISAALLRKAVSTAAQDDPRTQAL